MRVHSFLALAALTPLLGCADEGFDPIATADTTAALSAEEAPMHMTSRARAQPFDDAAPEAPWAHARSLPPPISAAGAGCEADLEADLRFDEEAWAWTASFDDGCLGLPVTMFLDIGEVDDEGFARVLGEFVVSGEGSYRIAGRARPPGEEVGVGEMTFAVVGDEELAAARARLWFQDGMPFAMAAVLSY